MGSSLAYIRVAAPGDFTIQSLLQMPDDSPRYEQLDWTDFAGEIPALLKDPFRLTRLPGSQDQPAAAPLADTELQQTRSADTDTERRSNVGNFQRILVAEDHRATRIMLVQMLRRWGFEPVAASNATEVLEVVDQQRPPELVIMSRTLPGLDAVELCRKITNRHAEYSPYILMLAMQNDSQELVRALESGAAEYLKTPFEADELRARLIVASRIIQRHENLVTSRDRFRLLATKDPLTNLWNRRSIQQILKDELARAAEAERTTGVLLIDLDYFKNVNDTHGHLAGDFVLKETSRRLKKALRAYDSIGRFGGEEFLVVVPGSTESELCELAERLRNAIEQEPVRAGENEISITLSVGVATAAPQDQSPTAILGAADAALYDAKRSGRNRICLRNTPRENPRPASLPQQRMTRLSIPRPQLNS